MFAVGKRYASPLTAHCECSCFKPHCIADVSAHSIATCGIQAGSFISLDLCCRRDDNANSSHATHRATWCGHDFIVRYPQSEFPVEGTGPTYVTRFCNVSWTSYVAFWRLRSWEACLCASCSSCEVLPNGSLASVWLFVTDAPVWSAAGRGATKYY